MQTLPKVGMPACINESKLFCGTTCIYSVLVKWFQFLSVAMKLWYATTEMKTIDQALYLCGSVCCSLKME